MAKIELAKLSRESLLELRKEIDEMLKVSEREARKQALAAAQKAAAEHGFSLEEVMAARKPGSGPKSAPKYANPDDATQTWTGRGRQPNWVKAALSSGKTLEDLSI